MGIVIGSDGMIGIIKDNDDDDCFEMAIRCDIKNYKNEIEKFCDWIAPYMACDGYEYVYGYKMYECHLPELLLIREGKPVWLKWGAKL